MGLFDNNQRQSEQLLKQYIEMLSKFPMFQYMKAPAGSIAELWRRYPAGGEYGWYAMVYDLKTIVYWDPEERKWQPISSAPTADTNTQQQIEVDTIDQLPTGGCGFTSKAPFIVDGQEYTQGTAYTQYSKSEGTAKSQLLLLAGGKIAVRTSNTSGAWTAPEALALKKELLELIQSNGNVVSPLTGTQYTMYNNQLIEF